MCVSEHPPSREPNDERGGLPTKLDVHEPRDEYGADGYQDHQEHLSVCTYECHHHLTSMQRVTIKFTLFSEKSQLPRFEVLVD